VAFPDQAASVHHHFVFSEWGLGACGGDLFHSRCHPIASCQDRQGSAVLSPCRAPHDPAVTNACSGTLLLVPVSPPKNEVESMVRCEAGGGNRLIVGK
jgi:hypothetical protein